MLGMGVEVRPADIKTESAVNGVWEEVATAGVNTEASECRYNGRGSGRGGAEFGDDGVIGGRTTGSVFSFEASEVDCSERH
jgi:hypothetical protein